MFFLVLVVTCGALVWKFMQGLPMPPPDNVNNYVVGFQELGESVYIRARSWGISGNHQEIIVATEPIINKHRVYFRERQYVFLDPELFYQKKGIDTLVLYVYDTSAIPESLSTRIHFIQVELKNYDEIHDFEENYERYGLTRASVYPGE